MEIFTRRQKYVVLCSGQAQHTSIRFPGSASSEVLIRPGPLQAVQTRVSSSHGQPAELCPTSDGPTAGSPPPSPCRYLCLTWAFHSNSHGFGVHSLLFLKPSSGSLSPQHKTLSMLFKHLACDLATLTSCHVVSSLWGFFCVASSLKNNFSLVHLWPLFWKVFRDTCTPPPPLQQNSSFPSPRWPRPLTTR